MSHKSVSDLPLEEETAGGDSPNERLQPRDNSPNGESKLPGKDPEHGHPPSENSENEASGAGNDPMESSQCFGSTCCAQNCLMKYFTRQFWFSPSTPRVDGTFWFLFYVVICIKICLIGINFYDLIRYASMPDWQFFFILLSTMLIPLVPINLFSYWWCKTDSQPHPVPVRIKLLHCLLLGYWWRQYRLHRQAKNVNSSSSAEARHRFSLSRADLTFLGLMAVYASSVPQLVFKLYRLTDRWGQHAVINYTIPVIDQKIPVPEAHLKVAFAVGTAIVLAFSTISHAHASRQHRWDKQELSNASRGLQVLYRMLFLSSRVFALACLFLLDTKAAWGICFGLFLLLLVWFRWLKTEFCEFAWQEWIYNIVLAYMHLFGVFNVKDTPARYRYFLYYSFSGLLEATIFLCVIRSNRISAWLAMFVLVFAMGVVCHVVEHKMFHPPGVGDPPRRCYIPRDLEPWELECQECLKEQERAAPDPTMTAALAI